jgi:elongation factor Ts
MAEITAAAVNALRQATDAPMMKCKQALIEANGDIEEAKIILRKTLGNKIGEKVDRVTAEGLVFSRVSEDRRSGALVELNCETDFVARNEAFKALGKTLAELVQGSSADTNDALLATDYSGQKVGDFINESAGPIGERVVLGRFVRFSAPEGNVVAAYVHNPGGSGDEGGKIGVLVELTGEDAATLTALGKDIAQHIAASNPLYLSEADVPEEVILRERDIAIAQASSDPKMAGKPANIIENMVSGRVRKELEAKVLLKQPFVRDPSKSIEAVLGGSVLVRFVRFKVGEGQAAPAPEAA